MYSVDSHARYLLSPSRLRPLRLDAKQACPRGRTLIYSHRHVQTPVRCPIQSYTMSTCGPLAAPHENVHSNGPESVVPNA